MTNVLPPLKEPTTMATTLEGKKAASVPLSNWGGTQTMVTSYSIDFGQKKFQPSEARPCSATRRNRPHPSQYFLNWRVPSKPLLGKTQYITEPQAAEYRNMLQNFSEEYKGTDEPKPSSQPSTNICKEITTDEKLKLIERLKTSGKPVETFQLPLPQLNPEALTLVADLLKKVTPQEREALEKAFGFREKESLELPAFTLITPEAISVLEQVLQKAGITDNDSAIRFLLSIGQVLMSITSSNSRASPKPRPSVEDKDRRHTLRSPPVRSPNFRMPKHSNGSCALCSKSSLTNELRDISEFEDENSNLSTTYPEHFASTI